MSEDELSNVFNKSSFNDIFNSCLVDPLPSSENVTYDRYGFSVEAITESPGSTSFESMVQKESTRIDKWELMISGWHVWSNPRNTTKYNKLKSRLRKGIPHEFRPIVWQKILKVDLLLARNEPESRASNSVYYELLNQRIDPNIESVIVRDLRRTFPNAQLLSVEDGLKSLYNILRAYAAANPRIGYCQALSFIAATFLINMSEIEAFWCMRSLLLKDSIESMYRPCLTGVLRMTYILDALIPKHAPKFQRYRSAQTDSGIPFSCETFAVEWFMTLFTRSLHHAFACRVIDSFLFEGSKVLYRFALALINQQFHGVKARTEAEYQQYKREGIEVSLDSPCFGPEQVLQNLFQCNANIKTAEQFEKIFNDGFSIHLTSTEIEKLGVEFDATPDIKFRRSREKESMEFAWSQHLCPTRNADIC